MEKIKNKVVLLRCGFNVPVKLNKQDKSYIIEDDYRIIKSLKTIENLIQNNNKIIILSHKGRDKKETLKAIFEWLREYLNKDSSVNKIIFDNKTFSNFDNGEKKVEKKIKELKEKIEKLNFGQILFLDNIRSTEMEKENDENLAQKLKDLADMYINDAFSVSHRKHLSVNALPKKFKKENKFLGLLFQNELKNLNKCFEPEKHNNKKDNYSVFVLGGAKLKTKAILMKSFLEKYNKVVIGGVLANTFYKKLGFEVGKSKVEDFNNNDFDFKEISEHKNFFLPNIVIVKNRNGKIIEKEITEVKKNETILDISPSAFFEIEDDLKKANFVLFNGPMGFYEDGFLDGTKYLLEIFNSKDNFFVAGGGNTVSLIREMELSENADFLSTGGGAMIDYLKDGELPGINAVLK